MNTATILCGTAPGSRDVPVLFTLLDGLRGGRLDVRLPDGSSALFGDGEHVAVLQVHDEALFGRVLARGDIGFAEAYLDGLWDSPDLTAVLTLLAANREVLKRAIYGSWRPLLAARIRHWLNRNSRNGSRRNIMAHYDLGNDFYRLWLDPTMSYSSALYGGAGELSLDAAQRAKYERILERLGAGSGQHVLEIGCGWGGFVERAVARGLRVTGLTLSPAQLAWAQQRVPGAELRLQDYRDLQERFDHVVSIEMFEAVGERWWPSYFRTVARSLKPGGKAVIQSITIRDDLFAAYRKGTDFIQQYIFPGGMLPSRSAFRKAAARAGLVVRDEHAFGLDYARTLAEWRQTFEARWPDIRPLGFDEDFRRLWRLYLSYCEAGFRAGSVDVVQFELAHA
ncbi:MAG TPA: cyclopropane-fatty-acyl-phospholipid synthase family protein [Aromatoleum sp.]|uniref:cyclopropane-fatty-acyl-phospholipid synthase family protein n=1 Tax=Aromatoleum sp. TaxID=2307007 RepID=UPI002B4A4F18|nr:cyclopropane-fatty-acyl-phospholipid synthase family protein [Aromatoleum sp.]HJV25145.1 cyclopropane-fatty-acyl-phospholipid synthase family protein [Aromatoleum sp.]